MILSLHCLLPVFLATLCSRIDSALAQCPSTTTRLVAGDRNPRISSCTSVIIPSGLAAIVSDGAEASVESGGTATLEGGTVSGEGGVVLRTGVIKSLAPGATVLVRPTITQPPPTLTLASLTGVAIQLIRGTPAVVSVRGSSNAILAQAGVVDVTGDSNKLFLTLASGTVTGSGNQVTVYPGAAYSVNGVGNTINAALTVITSSADGNKYVAAGAGTIRITDPGVSTIHTGAGTLEFLAPSATVTVLNGGIARVTDFGLCEVTRQISDTTRGSCFGSGQSATIRADGAYGGLLGSAGTAYITGSPPYSGLGSAGPASQPPNTIYGTGFAQVLADQSVVVYASSGALAIVASQGTAYIGSGGTAVVRSAGTARLLDISARATASPGGVVEAASTGIFATPTSTAANGNVIYVARGRLPSDPARRRALPQITGFVACSYPLIACYGLNRGYSCIDPQTNIHNCGGCTFGSVDERAFTGEDCTQLDYDGVQCKSGRCHGVEGSETRI